MYRWQSYSSMPGFNFAKTMNQLVEPDVIDQIQNAEKRYYVALQKYAQALKAITSPEHLEQLKVKLCDAYAALSVAQAKLSPGCDEHSSKGN